MNSAADPRWNRVKWSEAGQVAALADDLSIAKEEATLSPQAFVAARVSAGNAADALRFLALALPRTEAVAWAAETLEACGVQGAAERAAVDAAAIWLQDPDDVRRRSAWQVGQAIPAGPARFLGAAVFFSGGSIAPADCPAVPAPDGACGLMSGGVVVGACLRSPAPAAAMARALAAGCQIAAGEG